MFSQILAEIRHRFASFAIAVVVLAGATYCLLSTFSSLQKFDAETEDQLDALEKSTRKKMDGLENRIRKSMKGLGFNVHIYPETQNLSQVYEQGFASETMPEFYADKLAESGVVTVNHLLPRLSQRTVWVEKQRTIILIGIKGQVPIAHRAQKKPIMQPVKPGTVVLGYELHQSLKIKEGDSVTINGKSFKVAKTHPQRGSLDDITAWIPLKTAQQMLNKPNQINAILALGCNCASLDRLGEIRKEIHEILPGTRIIEVESKALARAEARNQVGKDAAATRESIEKTRSVARSQRIQLFSVIVPLVLLGSLIGIAALCFLNTNTRSSELGTLRALGFSSAKIASLILGRALMVGLLGALLGIVVAFAFGTALTPRIHGLLLLVAPLLTLAAAWLPALLAMRRDPLVSIRTD